MRNKSPWLEFDRPTWAALERDQKFDIGIIGGGIAGVSTLYFLLKNTNKTIVLLEKNHIASGATGHNAGFAINWHETVTQDLIKNFGIEKVRQGYKELDNGWNLFFEMLEQLGMKEEFTPLKGGMQGFTSIPHFLKSIEEEIADKRIGRGGWKYYLSQDTAKSSQIPKHLQKHVLFVSQKEILQKLKIKDKGYIAVAEKHNEIINMGRSNSALLCYKLLIFLEEKHPGRFSVFEQTEVQKIDLGEQIKLKTNGHEISVKDVVLCTNGYTNFVILDSKKNKTYTKLSDSISGIVGYMVGFFDKQHDYITSVLYDDRKLHKNAPYFYYNKAPFFKDKKKQLTVAGGPERTLKKKEAYKNNEAYPASALSTYKKFLVNTFAIKKGAFEFQWHGLLGYTDNGVRWVGRDRKYPHMLYNLGCNGIGFIPSIAGGEKISKIINGGKLPSSFTDPA